jgi:hypothetical protein
MLVADRINTGYEVSSVINVVDSVERFSPVDGQNFLLPSGFDSFKVNLNGNWANSRVSGQTAWGSGNNGTDQWGCGGRAALVASDIHQSNEGYYFYLSIDAAARTSSYVGCIFRYVRNGLHGVGTIAFNL